MPNKTYWNQVQEIMEFTDAMGSLLGKEAYGEGDRQETQEILRDVKERKERANDKPMEMITLAGLAREFKDVAKETRANYRNAESEEAKDYRRAVEHERYHFEGVPSGVGTSRRRQRIPRCDTG